MTPRRLDAAVIERKLTLLRALLDDLATAAPFEGERLRQERLLRHAVERILSQLVQLAVDVNAHVVTGLGGEAPNDYRDSFRSAAVAGVLPGELAASLLPSVGLRNLLVHEYAVIDLDQVASACTDALRDYAHYVVAVAGFLDTLPSD